MKISHAFLLLQRSSTTPFSKRAIMAILPAHPGLTVQVVVDDQPLPEYDDDEASQDVGSVTKYIQACAGSESKIQYSFDKTFPRNKDVRISCSIDGSIARKPTRRKFELGKGNIFSIDGTREKDGKNWKMRMFCFESLIIGMISHHADVSTK
jgi:hypothetical protein